MHLRNIKWLPARPWFGAQRVHIRPSRAGLAFAALLLALWIAAVNYRLGLGYALTYFAAACAITDMLFASRNLAGLSLAAAPGQPVFAGGHAGFTLRLINRSARSRHAIVLAMPGATTSPGTAELLANVAAHGETSVSIEVAAPQRGWLDAPPLRLSSNFPLGLFHAWCHWLPEARVLVLPRPEPGAPPLPLPTGNEQQLQQSQQAQQVQQLQQPQRGQYAPQPRQAQQDQHALHAADDALELAGVRAYQPGDPLQRLAWRQIARHDGEQVFSKHFEPASDMQAGGRHSSIVLDHAALAALPAEARLSRLAAWILEAERTSLPYGLRLDTLSLMPNLGTSHRDTCLRALALHGLHDPTVTPDTPHGQISQDAP